MLAVFGGGNSEYIAEHDPDLAPAPYHFVGVTVEAVAQIEATPTAPTPAAIAPTVVGQLGSGSQGVQAPGTPAVASSNLAPSPQGCPAIIVETFGEHAEAACAVAFCETSGTWNPLSHNTNGEDSRGLFQINIAWEGPSGPHGWASWLGVRPDALFDPEVNVRAAWLISSGGTDWSAWTCKPW